MLRARYYFQRRINSSILESNKILLQKFLKSKYITLSSEDHLECPICLSETNRDNGDGTITTNKICFTKLRCCKQIICEDCIKRLFNCPFCRKKI